MARLWLLTTLLLPWPGWSQNDGGSALDEASQLMREGLEREVPAPSLHPTPQWPGAEGARPPPRPEPGAASERVQALTERMRIEASTRARALVEERRTLPDEQPAVGQARTRAAKTVGPPLKPRPPRP